MAEGGEIPQVSAAEGQAAGQGDVVPVSPPETPIPQSQNRGFLGRVFGGLFGGKKQEAAPEQAEPQETDEQLRAGLAQLQADRLNIQSAMKSSDSTGSSKIEDNQRVDEINQRIAELNKRLPAETTSETQQLTSPTAPLTPPTPTETSAPVQTPDQEEKAA